MRNVDMEFATTPTQIDAYLERYRPWLESMLGCPLTSAVRVEMDLPFGDLLCRELLAGVPITSTGSEDALPDFLEAQPWPFRLPFRGPRSAGTQAPQEAPSSDGVRALVTRWQLPPGVSPGIRLEPSSNGPTPGWHAHWTHTPAALWLRDCVHAVVAVQVPVVHFKYGGGARESSHACVIINRDELKAALARLRECFGLRPHRIVVIGGDEIPLNVGGYDWKRVVLTPNLTREVQEDFERFLGSQAWFRTQVLPYRRSYLLHGPPGNGKTSVVRMMACHPDVSAFALNFSTPELGDSDVSELFARAARACPALVIIEDLDRLFGRGGHTDQRDQEADNRTAITLPHLLNCLDGLYSGEGVIVVATANRVRDLEFALRRRFNVTAAFGVPTAELRAEYFRRRTVLAADAIALAVGRSDRFTFAELAAAYTTAGTVAFERGRDVTIEDLTDTLATVRRAAHVDARARVGFGPTPNGDN